jgi:flagellin
VKAVSLSILNNIAALYAQSTLRTTQSQLQTSLQQLSSGSRINSGADDPAGLAVADGLQGNEAALTQSAINATEGIGLLQTADGALAQVTTLLEQGIQVATEVAGGTLTSGQVGSANQEYQKILAQIGNIGSGTNYNSNGVFSSIANSISVGDGTASGTSTYTDTVGVLTTASVGTTTATVQSSGSVSTLARSPQSAVPNGAGSYTLTPASSSDTLSGTLTFAVGGGGQQSITVNPGTTLGALATLLGSTNSFTSAGLSASASGGTLTITGPTSGPNAAANAVNFSGTSLTSTPAATALGAGSTGGIVIPATSSLGTLTFAGIPGTSTPPDTFSGTIQLSQAGESTVTLTIAPGPIGPSNSAGTVETQITQQLASTPFALAPVDGGNPGDPVFDFSGAVGNTAPLVVTNVSFADKTRGGVTFTPASPSDGTPQVTQNTYTLAALATSSDTFGAGNANTLDINNTSISVAGLTATQVKQAINSNAALQSAGITAKLNSDNTTLTIDGNINGAALSVLGYQGGALALTDQSAYDYPASTILLGSEAGATGRPQTLPTATLSITGAGANDHYGGTLTISQGSTSQLITINPNSTLNSLYTQLRTQAMSSGFNVRQLGGPNTPNFQVTSSLTGQPLTVTIGTLADSTQPSATVTGGVGTSGSPATQATFLLGALGSPSDTYGFGTANTLDINGTSLSVEGLTATQARDAINANTTLQSSGISASVNNAGTVLTILGDTYGDNLTVNGYQNGALALTDQSAPYSNSPTVLQSVAPTTGSAATGGAVTLGLNTSSDTLSGALSITGAGAGGATTYSTTFNTGTTIAEALSQLDGDNAFAAAGLSVATGGNGNQIVITEGTTLSDTLGFTGTSLTDHFTVPSLVPGPGVDFTAGGRGSLAVSNAVTDLASLTAAVSEVAYQRGSLGGEINQLASANSVASSESVNLASAQNSVTATDYGQAASNLSKYQILSQTGLSALAQANTVQQEVLKLLQ